MSFSARQFGSFRISDVFELEWIFARQPAFTIANPYKNISDFLLMTQKLLQNHDNPFARIESNIL